jgi:hypothetical protein
VRERADQDRVLGLVEQRRLFADPDLRALQLVDVRARAEPLLDGAVLADERQRAAEHPVIRAIETAQAVLVLVDPAAARGVAQLRGR